MVTSKGAGQSRQHDGEGCHAGTRQGVCVRRSDYQQAKRTASKRTDTADLMPTAPRRACLVSGCMDYASKHGRCSAHAAPIIKAREIRNEAGRDWYHTARWRKLRAIVLSAEPLCRHCLARESRPVPATDVDHIRRHEGDARKFWSRNNLQPLCSACHDRKTAIERGHAVARLPEAWGGRVKSLG